MKRSTLAVLVVILLCSPATASGDGPPVTSLPAGPGGVVEHDGTNRLVALPAATETIVAMSRVRGGQIRRALSLAGRWGVPVITEDGGAGGVSADSKTLVLFRLATGIPAQALDLLDPRSALVLGRPHRQPEGRVSFDALSPDGRWLYLVQQLSVRNRASYAVRAYDTERGRLMPEPVVDPREPDEPLLGFPTHACDGRKWALGVHPVRRRARPPLHTRTRHRRRASPSASTSLTGSRATGACSS